LLFQCIYIVKIVYVIGGIRFRTAGSMSVKVGDGSVFSRATQGFLS
jgi:hypothetical protein